MLNLHEWVILFPFNHLFFVWNKVEGVAYRGRILVEINSDLDHTIPKPIVQEMVYSKSQQPSYGVRKPYKLFGVFFSATSVRPHDDLVEFEVSIGKDCALSV